MAPTTAPEPACTRVYRLQDGRLAALLGLAPLPGTDYRPCFVTEAGTVFCDSDEPFALVFETGNPMPVSVALVEAGHLG